MLVNNELKIGVFALTSIKAGAEITLPFDFPYEQWLVVLCYQSFINVITVAVIILWIVLAIKECLAK